MFVNGYSLAGPSLRYRNAVAAAVDRRFNRARYDAGREVEALAGRLRDNLALTELVDEVLEVVDGTVHPVSAAVWIRDS
jgi:hypothetical protein